MPNRAARRAAAHQTNKAAAQTTSPISDAQLAANRANAQSSTGPKTEQGKLVSSHNALKTGLTGRTIVLPTDDVAAYQSLVALINKKFAPANDIEQHLTQTMLAEQAPTGRPETIADTEWRLLRIPTLESGFYALGRHELAADCAMNPTPNSAQPCSKPTSSAPIKRTSAISPCKSAASAINSSRTPPNSGVCNKNASNRKPQRNRVRQQTPLPASPKMALNFQLRQFSLPTNPFPLPTRPNQTKST